MPLYDFDVLDTDGNPTGRIVEEVVKSTTWEIRYEDGTIAKRRTMQMIADTKLRWGDSHAVWNPDLRSHVSSQRDIDRICREKDLIPIDDLPKGTMERFLTQEVEYGKHTDKIDQRFEQLQAKYGADGSGSAADTEAMRKVWLEHAPTTDLLNGTWDALKPRSDF